MKTIGIYRITAPDDSFYIGKSNDVRKRWRSHIKNDTHGLIQKYGEVNLRFEILEECSIEDLHAIETYYIYTSRMDPNMNIINPLNHKALALPSIDLSELNREEFIKLIKEFNSISKKYQSTTKSIRTILGYFNNRKEKFSRRLYSTNDIKYGSLNKAKEMLKEMGYQYGEINRTGAIWVSKVNVEITEINQDNSSDIDGIIKSTDFEWGMVEIILFN